MLSAQKIRTVLHNRSLLLLFTALVVAITAMTSVAFFVDRVDRGLVLQGASLMAADMVIEKTTPFADEWIETAQQMSLSVSRQVNFPSVIFHDDEPLLVQVKAVDEAYPLRGRLEVDNNSQLLALPPKKGRVYLDQQIAEKVLLPGSTSVIPLGELSLEYAGSIVNEPDRGGSLFQLAPRVMINLEDLDESGLLGPASRARYRLLVAGDSMDVLEFRAWSIGQQQAGMRILDIENSRPELRTALERGHRFLNLAALCASLLAGVAILLATRRYVSQVIDTAAIMRTLGMTGPQVLRRHLQEILLVLLMGVSVGILLGYLGQLFLSSLVGQWFGENLPLPGFKAIWTGLLYAAVLVPGFSLPVLMRIRQVSPLRVLRRELAPPDASSTLVWLTALGAFGLLVFWQVQDYRLAIALILALLAVMLLAVLIGWLLIVFLKPFKQRQSDMGLGLAALSRHAALTYWQLAGFSVGIALLLILGAVRLDLIDTWTSSLSPTTPNHFLINIQPEEADPLQAWFEKNAIKNSGMYASARGRLVKINQQAVRPDMFKTDRGRRLASREFSLGFSDQLQSDNRLVAGEPWPPADEGFSVEQGLAEKLGITPGTTLTFDIAGQALTGTVKSLRTISWDSFNVNFFVQGSTQLMKGLPVAYLNSIYLEKSDKNTVRHLADNYPSVSVLDLQPLLKQVRNIMDKGALAIEAVFMFTILAAMLVTVGAVQISREERAQEIAILRTLGASRRKVLSGVLMEFGLLGVLSGVIAASLSSFTGYLVATELFGLSPDFNPMLWLIGVCSGVLILLLVGYYSTRGLLRQPPLTVLNAMS